MTPELKTIDAALIEVDENLGQLHAWLDNPVTLPFLDIRERLERLAIPEDQVFLKKKRGSLLAQVGAMEAAFTPAFTARCKDYFENLVPTLNEVRLAREILASQTKKEKTDDRKLNAAEVAQGLRDALHARGLDNVATVIFPYEQVGTISIQPYLSRSSEIRVGPTVEKTERALKKTIAHEIEGHLYRSLNGRLQYPQSAFYSGTSGAYLLTEEGFTGHIEALHGFHENDRVPAAHVIAVDAMLHGATLQEITTLLSELEVASKTVESIATKAKRGVKPDEEGGYVGGAAYLLGRLRVNEFIKSGGSLETLYVGKISLEDVPLVEKMLKANQLQQPRYTITPSVNNQ